MQTTSQPLATALHLAGVDCDSSFDFAMWIESGESMFLCPLTVHFSEYDRDAVDRVVVDDLKAWWGHGASVDDARAFVKANEGAVFAAVAEAFEARKRRWS